MFRIILLLCVMSILSGCASFSHSLPKCDGYSRRPLNRSMWRWQDSGDLKQQYSALLPTSSVNHAIAYADETPKAADAAFAHLDITGSYRPCSE